jgi:energy-converting hydrogenase Eha subunit C
MPPVLVRALLALCASAALLLYYEYFYHKHYRNKPLPLSVGLWILLPLTVYRVSAVIAGAAGALLLYRPSDSMGRAVAVFGGLAGLWASAIFLQVAQNGVRRAIGARTYPIQWIRPMRRGGRK